MRVIADSSPRRYLVLIDSQAILSVLFDQVVIPPAVVEELQRPRTPAPVRVWMAMPPAWREVRPPRLPLITTTVPIGAGEREAIRRARDLQADMALMDDLEARAEAEQHGVAVMGTLRVLELAAESGLSDLPTAIAKLEATSFYLPRAFVEAILARDAARKSRPPT